MKYIIKFEKTGVICYISHLDVIKVFKRAFKRAGIKLAYSQGFNPHPKMGFAQPLSLGYRGYDEYIEFETAEECECNRDKILKKLQEIMPEGIFLSEISEASEIRKTLASMTVAADYEIVIPLREIMPEDAEGMLEKYMAQEKIHVLKKQKKKKEPVIVDIKPKIRDIAFKLKQDELTVTALLDAGSDSNLSPELLIDSMIRFFIIECSRDEITVSRTKLHFK